MSSAEPTRIRLAVSGDLDAILLLARDIENLPHWAAADYRVALDESVAEPRRCLFVAEVGGQLAGLAVGLAQEIAGEGSAELETVGVAFSMQRCGLGRQLCVAVVEWCRLQGAAYVDLEVRSRSSGPIALYRELGFEALGNRPDYYRDPADDAILMRLDLTATRSPRGAGATTDAEPAP